MKCKQIKEKFPDFLINDLDQEAIHKIQDHIKTCSSCREELEGLTEIWTRLGVLQEERPSNALRNNFYSMLEDYKKGLEREKSKLSLGKLFIDWLEPFWLRKPVFQLVAALLLLAVGLTAGYFINSGRQRNGELAQLRQDVRYMSQLVAVSLLKQQSPSERLRGVSFSSRVTRPDEETLDALFRTLNNDTNVNVRLAAIDALYLFYNNPVVRENLIKSLSQQTSPLVQITLIDLIVEMRERRAIEALKELIQNEKLNPDVRKRAELSLQKLS